MTPRQFLTQCVKNWNRENAIPWQPRRTPVACGKKRWAWGGGRLPTEFGCESTTIVDAVRRLLGLIVVLDHLNHHSSTASSRHSDLCAMRGTQADLRATHGTQTRQAHNLLGQGDEFGKREQCRRPSLRRTNGAEPVRLLKRRQDAQRRSLRDLSPFNEFR